VHFRFGVHSFYYHMRLILLLFLSVFSAENAIAQTDCPLIAYWDFNEVSGEITKEKIGSLDFQLNNNYNKPERITSVDGTGLRLDGFSTWASAPFTMPATRKFSISLWYATEAYPTETGAFINQQEGNTGFGLELDKYGFVSFVIHADGTRQRVTLEQPLPKYKWNFITAVADLEQKFMRVTLNDTVMASVELSALTAFDWTSVDMKIARHNQSNVFIDIWPLGVLNGLIDEIKLYNCSLTENDALNEYKVHKDLVPDLSIPVERHLHDPIRPRFHAMPPTSWTNEPYGLLHHDGYYHLFYQKNPNGPYHSHMHWGHLRSRDLLTWEDQPIALAPEPGWDQVGIWSGVVVEDAKDSVHAIYTGVDGVKAGIGIAHASRDLKVWTKDKRNPLIPNPPPTYNHLDFRDPMVWQYNGMWYMIVGSGIRDVGGILMTYTSSDLINWQVTTPLYYGQKETSAQFWEMPSFVKMSESKWMLLVNTLPYQGKPAETLYWIGEWSGSRFKPDTELPKKFEVINGPLLAPSINLDGEGRITAIGIIPETRNSISQNRTGWTHIYSLPRVLRLLDDGNIGQIPHPNLCGLRTEEVISIEQKSIEANQVNNLGDLAGDELELNFKIVVNAPTFTIRLRQSADGYEYTDLNFDEVNNKIQVDRRNSSISSEVEKDVKEGIYTFSREDTLALRIFIDHSAVEVFIDDIASISTRIYPTLESSLGYDITTADGTLTLLDFHAWTLDTATASTQVCEETLSRNTFRTELVTSTENEVSDNSIEIFPNPADEFVYLDIEKVSTVNILDSQGATVRVLSYQDENRIVDVKDIKTGLYLMRIATPNKVYYKRLIIKHP